MENMIIGITGSFGSGKTTIANIFKEYGFEVIDVDKLYRDIYAKNKGLKNKIKKEFGTINRDKLKKIVFTDFKKLRRLNSITHPIIVREIKKLILKNKKYKKDIIIDAPLLIEAKATKLVDKVIVVKTNRKNSIKRVLKKKKYSKNEIEHILKSQMPLKQKLKYADFIIDNNKSLKNAREQIKKIIKKVKTNKQ
jgi:dephospho-CoA kinase